MRFADSADAALLGFIPASTAIRVTALSSLVPVPGAPPQVVGIALADGAVVTVLRLGDGDPGEAGCGEDAWPIPGSRRAVLCRLGGHDVALTGGSVVATGVFDAAPVGEGIVWCGQMVPALDVRAIYAQAEAATWAGRAATGRALSRPAAPSTPRPPAHDDQADAGPSAEDDDDGERTTWLPDEPIDKADLGPRADDDTRRGTR